ncbi:hypothetical protein ABEB36_006430 [Hypothenemus hampei]|uniref:Uncharacterized protein n=1 Tax=Hypothenemus hampei TaxID=57062 RepID=A0ABD1EQH9_HYPHA
MFSNSNSKDVKWQHPKDLLKIQKLRYKKEALQKRIKQNSTLKDLQELPTTFEDVFKSRKRKNPFAIESTDSKKPKCQNEDFLNESSDQTLYKLLNNKCEVQNSPTTFTNILLNNQEPVKENIPKESRWCPVDWTLKRKVRLISSEPFVWSKKLKISEESSGVTSFIRCLDMDKCESSLDVSPNAKFHQRCLYWQQPSLPWLPLFPRNPFKPDSSGISCATIKASLYETWTDSLKSLFQLIRTRQCPYFYVCANSFTALFRAAGIAGYTDVHVMVTPTSRGFRHLLKQEDIEFEMPLTEKDSDENSKETEIQGDDDDEPVDDWLSNLGVQEDEIKNINYTQNQITHKSECQLDRTDQSLILIKGVEVNAFFNFLLNCKSTISPTGILAGIPPTLLAPVAFYGATLVSLKVQENRIRSDTNEFYSIDLIGPIMPCTIQNIFNINSSDRSLTMTFTDLESTRSFSKVPTQSDGNDIFGKENLSDCGLNDLVLNRLCSNDSSSIRNVECLKYSGESKRFSWS